MRGGVAVEEVALAQHGGQDGEALQGGVHGDVEGGEGGQGDADVDGVEDGDA